MRLDHIQDDEDCLSDKAPTSNMTHNNKPHELVLKCDEPEDGVSDRESKLDCPCCINPWIR